MTEKQISKISTWTLWSPLKFALITLGLILIGSFIYMGLTGDTTIQPHTDITAYILLLAILSASITIQLRTLPKIKMDHPSFVLVHNIQTIILSTLFFIGSIAFILYSQHIYSLVLSDARISTSYFILMITYAFTCLYLLGLMIANTYAKFRRIRELNIPTWKIIFSIPFGFSALWAPGYILDIDNTKSPSLQPKSKWLAKINKWVCSHTTHTIISFIIITLISILFFGINSVLLTFALTLIFGIWTIQVGKNKFIKNISNKYASTAVIFNIALLLTIISFSISNEYASTAVIFNIALLLTIIGFSIFLYRPQTRMHKSQNQTQK